MNYEVVIKFYVEAQNDNVAYNIADKIGAYIYRTDGIDSDIEEIKEVD